VDYARVPIVEAAECRAVFRRVRTHQQRVLGDFRPDLLAHKPRPGLPRAGQLQLLTLKASAANPTDHRRLDKQSVNSGSPRSAGIGFSQKFFPATDALGMLELRIICAGAFRRERSEKESPAAEGRRCNDCDLRRTALYCRKVS